MSCTPRSTSSALHDKLQSCIDGVVKAGVPGISAAITTSKGPLWSGTAGLASIEDNIPISDHVFGIGSITKVFMSVVILQLIDEGHLGLEDKASKYLKPSLLIGIPNASEATISLLLRHFSGIPSWEDDPIWIREGRGSKLDPDKNWTSTKTLEYIRYDSNPNLTAPVPAPVPNKFSYSNTNFTLLGLIAILVTRKPPQHLIRTRILKPLHLSHTHLEAFETPPASVSLPQRYHWATPPFLQSAGPNPAFSTPSSRPDLQNVSASNLSTEWVAGGNISSPHDLCIFASAVRNAKILSPSSLAQMLDFVPVGNDKPNTKWIGHGIMKLEIRGRTWIGHNGSVLGFAGSLWWNEDVDVEVAVLGNVGTMHAGVVSSAATVVAEGEFLELALELAGL